jgi:hypothetical protein
MPFPNFDRNSLAFFATLAATLTLFASSLFYNRIEAPLAILILIAAILLRGQLFTHFDKVKILLIVHTVYAISMLSNGISFGSRAYTSFDAGISNFANVMMVSMLGAVFLSSYTTVRLDKKFAILLTTLALALFVYCASYEGRVYDLTGRYVYNVGFLLTILSLCQLARLQSDDRFNFFITILVNTCTLYVTFIGIESRAMTLSLICAWIFAFFSLKHKYWQKFLYIFVPIAFCVSAIIMAENKVNDLSRYAAFESLFQVLGYELSLTDSTQQPDQINDGSLSTRYQMLKIGIENSLKTWPLGQGNEAESKLLREHIGDGFSTLHNLYLSYLVVGGVLHLFAGLAFILAPMVISFSGISKSVLRNRLHLIIFMLSLMMFGSHVQLTGFQNLYIVYSYFLLACLNLQKQVVTEAT